MINASLSHERAITRIQDPIHDLISLTCFEREIVDSEYFQRLHFVLQNSTTYVAFPSNKNSRFSHSLGVCHLSGNLLSSALRNASPQDLRSFLETAGQLLVNIKTLAVAGTPEIKLRNAWKKTISGYSGFRHAPSLRSSSNSSLESISLDEKFPKSGNKTELFTTGMLVDTLWQAIRICGLVHDIGHLPMSHSLESSVKKFKKRLSGLFPKIANSSEGTEKWDKLFSEITCTETYNTVFNEFGATLKVAYSEDDLKKLKTKFESSPLHERRSIYIVGLLLKHDSYAFDSDVENYRELVYHITLLILISSLKSEDTDVFINGGIDNSAFRFLKLLVAGSVDGDRMDYTIRDGHACGSSIGQYNIPEIVDNITLFKDKNSNDFKVGFYYRSLPAIENFFQQRELGYKHLIYHRTSSRTEACLQALTLGILEYCFKNPKDDISKYFKQLGFFCNSHSTEGKHKLFPVYSSHEAKKSTESWSSKEVPFLDDSSLRSFLEWLLVQLNTSEAKEDWCLAQLRLLILIVSKRKFEHIYDPFKDNSLFVRTANSLKKAGKKRNMTDKEIEQSLPAIFTYFVRTDFLKAELLKKFESVLQKKLPKNVFFINNEQKPKIYDHNHAMREGEDLYLLYNGVDESGTVPARPIVHASSFLRTMPSKFVDDFRIRYYFIALGIKTDDSLSEAVDSAVDDALDQSSETLLNKFIERKSNV